MAAFGFGRFDRGGFGWREWYPKRPKTDLVNLGRDRPNDPYWDLLAAFLGSRALSWGRLRAEGGIGRRRSSLGCGNMSEWDAGGFLWRVQ